MSEAEIICYCKGVCYPNPGGLMAYGWFAITADDLLDGSGCIADNHESTTWRAYFYAILEALKALSEHNADKIIGVRTDLKGAINQINYFTQADYNRFHHSDLIVEIRRRRRAFRKFRLEYVPAEHNEIAKALAMTALTTQQGEKQP